VRAAFRLTTRQPSIPIDIDFPAVAVVITNTTASPVFLRIGAPDAPSATNADLFCPAGESISFPVSGYTFAASFGNVAAIQSTDIVASGLFQTCVITFLGAGEVIPTYGSASFLSLSISDLWSNLAGAGPLTFPIIDLGPWGGAIVFVAPTAASGQGILKVEFSTDQVTWITAGQWAFWPSIPSTLNVQRVARYARISTLVSGIVGEPALAYAITARASLSEVAQLTYVPFTSSISKVVNVPSLGEQNWVLCTTNTPAIDVSLDITSVGGGNAAEELICETSVLPIGPWQTVSFREQNAAPLTGDLFRSYGNLNAFTRIRLLEIGNNGPLGGTIGFSIRPAPDLSGILQSIYAALGDVGYTPNVNQDIFHLLAHIETWTGQTSVSVASIDTKTSTVITSLGTINSTENSILFILTSSNTTQNSMLTTLGTISTTLSGISNTLVTMSTQLTAINTSLGTINTSIGATNTALGTVNTTLGTISTNIATINTSTAATAAAQTRVGAVATAAVAIAGAGVWTNGGALLVPGWYITAGQAGLACGAATANTLTQIGYGTNAAVVASIYQSYITVSPVAGGVFMGAGPSVDYSSTRSAGILIPAANTTIWVYSLAPLGATVSATFMQTP